MSLPRTDLAYGWPRTITRSFQVLLLLLLGVPIGVAREESRAGGPARQEIEFMARLDRASVLRGGDGLVRAEIVLGAPLSTESELTPTDLVLILDRSGSMKGEKIERVKAATRELLSSVSEQDRFALVTYAGNAELTVPLGFADRSNLAWANSRLSEAWADGSTNISQVLALGLAQVAVRGPGERVPRIVLLSDGKANQGDTSLGGLGELARQARRGEFAISTVGVGLDFNERLLTRIADEGEGNFYYLDEGEELADIFGREFHTARMTVLRGLRVELKLGPGVEVVDAAGYPLERSGSSVDFFPGGLFDGQERRFWITFRVADGRAGELELGRLAVSYSAEGSRRSKRLGEVLRITRVDSREAWLESFDLRRWERAVASQEYGALLESVAEHLSTGDRGGAQAELGRFRQRIQALNEHLGSCRVDLLLLTRLVDLEDEIRQAVTERQRRAKARRYIDVGRLTKGR